MAPQPGFMTPLSETHVGERTALEVAWLSGPTVAVALSVSAAFVTPAMPRGVYYVYSSDPAYVNAGIGGGSLDATVTSANAASPDALAATPKIHDGGYWPVALNDGESIAVKPRGTSIAEVRIFKGA